MLRHKDTLSISGLNHYGLEVHGLNQKNEILTQV